MEYPDTPGGDHLTPLFMEIGPAMPGPASIPYTEIDAWCRLMHTRLDRWEIDAIVSMSRAYVDEIGRSDGRNTQPPYRG